MGIISSSYFIAYTVMTFVWGVLADKIGPRKCMLSGLVIIAVGLASMGFMTSPITGALFYLISGAGAAAISVPVVPLLSRWFSQKRRGRAIGTAVTGYGVTLAVLGLVVPMMLDNYPWRWTWWIVAACVLVIAAISWFLLVNTPEEKGLSPVGAAEKVHTAPGGKPVPSLEQITAPRVTFMDIIKRGTVWNMAGIYFTHAIGYSVFLTFAVAYLEEIGWEARAAAGALAAWGAIGIPAPVIIGFFADYIAKKYLIIFTLLSQGLGLLIFLSSGTVGGYVGATIIGIGAVCIPLLLKTAMADYYEPTIIGTTFGLITLCFGLGSTVGPAIGGSIADATGSLRTALLVGLGATATAFVLALILRKPPPAPVQR
jgi:sugar phosphate permease